MGSALALREKTTLAPGTPIARAELKEELRAVADELKVQTTFMGRNSAIQRLESGDVNDDLWLLVFDIDKWTVQALGFRDAQLDVATEKYMEAEKEIANGANKQAVLVGVDSVEVLARHIQAITLTQGFFQKPCDVPQRSMPTRGNRCALPTGWPTEANSLLSGTDTFIG
jgi:hypothetical protein